MKSVALSLTDRGLLTAKPSALDIHGVSCDAHSIAAIIYLFLSQTALQGCDYRSLPNPTAVVCGCVRTYVRNAVCLLRRESVRTMKSVFYVCFHVLAVKLGI